MAQTQARIPAMFRRQSAPNHPPQPGQSILLNGNTASSSQAKELHDAQQLESAVSTPGDLSTEGDASSSARSLASTTQDVPPTPSLSSSAKISFAPLPVVPDLKRRNSITLGVAARKNLLAHQGSAPPRAPSAGAGMAKSQSPGGMKQVYMTDEEWETYKKQYEDRHGGAVDLGELAKTGAKSLWRKVRSSSQSSTTSTTSNASQASSSQTQDPFTASPSTSFSNVPSSPRRLFGARRNSAPTKPALEESSSSMTTTGNAAKPSNALDLHTVPEEDRSQPASPNARSSLSVLSQSPTSESQEGGDSQGYEEWAPSPKSQTTTVSRPGPPLRGNSKLSSPPPRASPAVQAYDSDEDEDGADDDDRDRSPDRKPRLLGSDQAPEVRKNTSSILAFDVGSQQS